MGRNHTKITFFLPNPSFLLSPSSPKRFWHQMSILRPHLVLFYTLSVRPSLAYTQISISHFWHFSHLLVFISLSFIIYFTLAFKLSFDPWVLILQISKFSLFHLGLFPDSINFSFEHIIFNHMLTYSFHIYHFHNLTIYQFSRKNPSLAQFIPGIYNKNYYKNSRVFLGRYKYLFI